MALIQCPECGKEISDKAVSCPNCGCPIKDSIITNSEIKEIIKKERVHMAKEMKIDLRFFIQ